MLKDLLQSAILRITTSKSSQKKSKQRLISEHERLEIYRDLDEIDIHDKFRQKGQSTLDSQLLLKNRISIKNLRVNNVGKSLLCRTITRCVKLDAILIVVEDPEGNVERLALYNWVKPAIPKIPKEGRLGPLPINQILTLATKLVIKNPSLG
jgi:hypothetical protein